MIDFDLKVGDYVYCHTDRYSYNTLLNKKGNCYKIKFITRDFSIFYDNIAYFILIDNGSDKLSVDVGFWIFNKEIEKDKKYILFNDYFITMKEYRKIKLEQLNERV